MERHLVFLGKSAGELQKRYFPLRLRTVLGQAFSQKFSFVQTAYYVVLQTSGDWNNSWILFAFQLFIIKRLIVPDDKRFNIQFNKRDKCTRERI